MLRLKWEAEEELRKIREKEEWIKLDYYRRHNPQTKEDFEVLYNALERKFETAFVYNNNFIIFHQQKKTGLLKTKGRYYFRMMSFWIREFKEMNNVLYSGQELRQE